MALHYVCNDCAKYQESSKQLWHLPANAEIHFWVMKTKEVSSESVEAAEDKVDEGYEEGSKVLIQADQMPPMKDV